MKVITYPTVSVCTRTSNQEPTHAGLSSRFDLERLHRAVFAPIMAVACCIWAAGGSGAIHRSVTTLATSPEVGNCVLGAPRRHFGNAKAQIAFMRNRF